jgi:hypothetical protein
VKDCRLRNVRMFVTALRTCDTFDHGDENGLSQIMSPIGREPHPVSGLRPVVYVLFDDFCSLKHLMRELAL